MRNPIHEANRKAWDERVRRGGGQVDKTRRWQECWRNAGVYFLLQELNWLGDVNWS